MTEQLSKHKKNQRSSIFSLQWGGRQDDTWVEMKRFYSLEIGNKKGSYKGSKKSNLTDKWINTKVKNPNSVKDY